MTYGLFLVIFLGVPLLACFWLGRRTWRSWPWRVIIGLIIVALVYTGPWDNFIIAQHIWTYPSSRVSGLAIGLVPIEEYTFYVLQVILTGIIATILLRKMSHPTQVPKKSPEPELMEG